MSTIDLLYRNLPPNAPPISIHRNFSESELNDTVATTAPLYVIASLIQLKVEELNVFLTKKLSPNARCLVMHAKVVIDWDEKLKKLRQKVEKLQETNRLNQEAMLCNKAKVAECTSKHDECKARLGAVSKDQAAIDKKLDEQKKAIKAGKH